MVQQSLLGHKEYQDSGRLINAISMSVNSGKCPDIGCELTNNYWFINGVSVIKATATLMTYCASKGNGWNIKEYGKP